MRDTTQTSAHDHTPGSQRLPLLGYLLYALGILFGITALIGVIINHTKLPHISDVDTRSHIVWQIVSFWILFAGIALVVVLWPGGYSKMLAYTCLFWWIASALTGIWYLAKKRPIPFLKSSPQQIKKIQQQDINHD